MVWWWGRLTGRFDGEVEEVDEPSEHIRVDGLREGVWLRVDGVEGFGEAGRMPWLGSGQC